MHRNKRRRIEKSLHAYKPVYMQRNQWRNFQGPRLALVHLKKYIFANNSKPLGLGHFRQFSTSLTQPNITPIKFQAPTTPGGRDSILSPKSANKQVVLSGRSEIWGYPSPKIHFFHLPDTFIAGPLRVRITTLFSNNYRNSPGDLIAGFRRVCMATLRRTRHADSLRVLCEFAWRL